MPDAGLIHLSWIDQVDLLEQLFEEIIVPPAVKKELLAAPPGTRGLDLIRDAFDNGWLQIGKPSGSGRTHEEDAGVLDRGEAEALQLTEELRADLLLSDDIAARRLAVQRGVVVAGTIGVLSRARDQGLIEAALPSLLELRRLGQWISEELIQEIAKAEGGDASR